MSVINVLHRLAQLPLLVRGVRGGKGFFLTTYAAAVAVAIRLNPGIGPENTEDHECRMGSIL